jgi:TatD DNase family protein
MLIDSHCHLSHKKYEKSIDVIISEAGDFGVGKMINIGTSMDENRKAIDISGAYRQVFCAIGIHPYEDIGISLDELRISLDGNLKKSNKIVAVGECGMDVLAEKTSRDLNQQEELFEMQVIFAKEHRLPVIVHDRKCDDSVLEILKKHSGSDFRGVVHCFDSDWEFAKKVLDIGFYISFTNLIGYPKKDTLIKVVKNVPDDRFLLETDAPYLPPQTMRGEINYPKYVKIVAEKVAQIRQKPFEEISELSCGNTCSLFNLC